MQTPHRRSGLPAGSGPLQATCDCEVTPLLPPANQTLVQTYTCKDNYQVKNDQIVEHRRKVQIEYQGMVMGLHNILTAAELPTRFQPAGSDSCTMSCPHSLCGILQNLKCVCVCVCLCRLVNLKNSHKQTHLYQEHAHPLKGTLTQTPINSETHFRNITIHPTPSTARRG